MLGTWSIDWEYSYPDINSPSIQQEGSVWSIIIEPKAKKGKNIFNVFGTGDNGKIVPLRHGGRDGARRLRGTIDRIRTSQT